jgi:uncharacterized membrane protein SirB2
MKKKNEIKYKAWNEYLNLTREKTNYAIRRFDLLLISLSGAGIYIIFETIREFKTGSVVIEDPKILIISGICLLFSIISNFLSQYTGYLANDFEEKFIIIMLCKIAGDKFDEKKKKENNNESKRYTKITNRLNKTSMALLFLGLGTLAYFNFDFFW